MNPTILNREFQHPADAWYQIEAKGSHPNRAAGVVQVIDDAAAQSIVNRFNTDAQAGTLRHGHELLIDHEHFSDQADKESRAYGWLTALQNRADGIYGQIRWTKTGKEAVDGGDYRFFSTEYDPSDLTALPSPPRTGRGQGEVSNREPAHVRPTRLAGLTLTNMNNNRGQRPITNRASTPDPRPETPDPIPPSPGTSPEAQSTPTTKNRMKSIAAELGLAPEAAEEAVLAEVRKLKNRADSVAGLTTERDTLKNRNTELEAEQVDGLLAAHGVKEEKVLNRLKPVLATMKNRADREAFLAECVAKPTEAAPAKPAAHNGRVLNRGTAEPPATTTAPAPNAQAAVVRLIQNREKCDFRRAWDLARVEKPELFA